MSESTDLHTSAGTSGWQAGMATSAGSHSLIGPTVVIKGEVSAEEDLLVMGRVEGFIDHSQTVTVHAKGVVAAEVKAQEVLIEGTVDGNVYGTKRVEIAETGTVNGNVYAPRVGVLEGASFKGAIDMDADVSAIERRFREQTGTEAPAKPEPKAASQKTTADEPKGDSHVAQVDEEGSRDHAKAASGTGKDGH